MGERARAGRQFRSALVLAGALVVGATAFLPTGNTSHTGCRPWRENTTCGSWSLAYDGYGAASGIRDDGEWRFRLEPAAAHSPDQTHAALAISAESLADMEVSVRLVTRRQLRDPAPNYWEVAWLLWCYTDDLHFYYLALKPNGWEVGKEDPAYPGAQRYLATGSSPTYPIGRPYNVRIRKMGPAMQIFVDGDLLVRVQDNERPYRQGLVGLYSEDAAVEFSHIEMHHVNVTRRKAM